jgi:hypothetical protein
MPEVISTKDYGRQILLDDGSYLYCSGGFVSGWPSMLWQRAWPSKFGRAHKILGLTPADAVEIAGDLSQEVINQTEALYLFYLQLAAGDIGGDMGNLPDQKASLWESCAIEIAGALTEARERQYEESLGKSFGNDFSAF